jgi:2-oxoacid:acceptor oxidoreductase delta subunit (pyruvate/2-ketoisovalerate family)
MKQTNDKKLSVGAIITEPGSTVKNKTGGWRIMVPIRDAKKCTKCGFCWMYCPEGCIDKEFVADLDYCKGCGICAKECPFGAIKMEKEKK